MLAGWIGGKRRYFQVHAKGSRMIQAGLWGCTRKLYLDEALISIDRKHFRAFGATEFGRRSRNQTNKMLALHTIEVPGSIKTKGIDWGQSIPLNGFNWKFVRRLGKHEILSFLDI